MQIVKNRRYPFKYKSEIWNQVKRKYDTIKRECRVIFKAFKKFRSWLYKIHFFLKTDINVLAT
jgi:hypothetical protein